MRAVFAGARGGRFTKGVREAAIFTEKAFRDRGNEDASTIERQRRCPEF
jgi:hypothetical protein